MNHLTIKSNTLDLFFEWTAEELLKNGDLLIKLDGTNKISRSRIINTNIGYFPGGHKSILIRLLKM